MINKFISFITLFLSMTKNAYALGYFRGGNCYTHHYASEEFCGNTTNNLVVFLFGIAFPGILLLIIMIQLKIDEKKNNKK